MVIVHSTMVQRRHILPCAPVTLVTVFLCESYKISSPNLHCARKIVYLTQLYRTQHLSRPFYITPVLLALTMSLHDEDGYVGLLLAVEQSCCISRPWPLRYNSSNRPFQALLHVRFLRFHIFRSQQFPNEQCCLGSQQIAKYPPSCLPHQPTWIQWNRARQCAPSWPSSSTCSWWTPHPTPFPR